MIPLLARKRIAELVALAAFCSGLALAGAMALASVDAARAQDGGGAVSGQALAPTGWRAPVSGGSRSATDARTYARA